MAKLYSHLDKFVELEFINAFNDLSDAVVKVTGTVGPQGPQGPQGPPGEDGQSAIQTLIVELTDSGNIGTMPAYSFITDVWGWIMSFDGELDNNSFLLNFNSIPKVSTLIPFLVVPVRLWPESSFYTDPPAEWLGRIFLTEQVIDFVTPHTGRFIICLNYITMTELLILNS
jgi:hypothetical protein